MRAVTLLCAGFLFALVGCSGGGGGSSPASTPVTPAAPTPTAKVRFVNAATRMGSLTFSAEGFQAIVPARSASDVFNVPVAPITFTATDGTTSVTRSLLITAGTDTDVVAFEEPVGSLSLDSILGSQPAPSTQALLTYFNFGDVVSGPSDAYIVVAGADIASASPTFPLSGGSIALAPGTYKVVITPPNSKTILFQSEPFDLAAGRNVVLIGAPASARDLTAQPIVVTFDQPPASLADSRPAVTLLKRLDPVQTSPMTISLDGNIVAQFAGPSAASLTYHANPGTHHFSDGVVTDTTIQIDAGNRYVQRFGFFSLGPTSAPARWLQPDSANDYPAPLDKARVRLIVEALEPTCAVNVAVDGAFIAYASQAPGNAGVTFDHAPGDLQVNIGALDGTTLLGSRTVQLKAGHYYVARAIRYAISEFTPSSCLGPNFEISGDE